MRYIPSDKLKLMILTENSGLAKILKDYFSDCRLTAHDCRGLQLAVLDGVSLAASLAEGDNTFNVDVTAPTDVIVAERRGRVEYFKISSSIDDVYFTCRDPLHPPGNEVSVGDFIYLDNAIVRQADEDDERWVIRPSLAGRLTAAIRGAEGLGGLRFAEPKYPDRQIAKRRVTELASVVSAICRQYGATITTDEEGWVCASVQYGKSVLDCEVCSVNI